MLFLSNLGLTCLLVTLSDSLTSNDVLFPECNRRRQPFKQLCKASVVLFNILRRVIINQLFAVVDRLVAFVGLGLLAEHFVLGDALAQVLHLLLG